MRAQFCELFVDRFSRTNDRMVQAARSGVQNIAEAIQASGTSKKFELTPMLQKPEVFRVK